MTRTQWIVPALLSVAVACGDSGRETQTASSAPPPTPAPAPPAVTGPRIYVTNERGGTVTIIDAASLEVAATVPLGKRPRGIVTNADGSRVYVALSGSPIAGPGVDEKTLPPADKGADGIGVVDTASQQLLRCFAPVPTRKRWR